MCFATGSHRGLWCDPRQGAPHVHRPRSWGNPSDIPFCFRELRSIVSDWQQSTIPLILCRRAYCDQHLEIFSPETCVYVIICTVLSSSHPRQGPASYFRHDMRFFCHELFMLFGSFSPFVAFRFLKPFFRFQVSFREGVRRPKSAILERKETRKVGS